MSRGALRYGVFFALLLLGIGSQVVQAWLVREGLVVFYGNEVSLGAFFASWLWWIALGSWTVMRLRKRAWVQQARLALARILLLLPPLLVIQVLILRSLRRLFDIPSIELVPLGDLFLAVLVVTLPSGLALGLAFPLACKALEQLRSEPATENLDQGAVRDVSGLYVVEALGALLGGALFTFVLVQWSGVWRGLGGLMLALAAGAWWLSPARRGLRAAALVLGLGGVLLAATPLAPRLQARLEALRFASLQPGLTLLEALETRYGHVALARLGSQFSVVRDGHVAESFPQQEAVRETAAYVYTQAAGARRVLMFGGAEGGLPAELLRYPVTSLDLVEQDPEAFRRIEPYLPRTDRAAFKDPRLHLHFIDGRRYLNTLKDDRLDLVLALDAVPTSAHSNRYFTREFYARVRANLAPDGVFCTRVSGASHYLGSTVRSYTGSVYRTLASVFPHIAILPGDTQMYCASPAAGRVSEDPSELRRRYLGTDLDQHLFPDLSFYSLLPADEISYLHSQLEGEDAPLNSDARPVTYYLNMMLWGRFTASGFVEWLEALRRMGLWPYLVPVAALLGLWLLRSALEGVSKVHRQRQAAGYVLVVLGLTAMGAQLTLLFGYQAQVGFMFERVALLNALFMTGLALGTGSLGRRLARCRRPDLHLVWLLLLTAAALLGLAPLLNTLTGRSIPVQETAYLGLSALFGLVTGAGFPVGVAQAHRELGETTASGGLAEAADSLGGAFGGLLTGTLLVPLLGVAGTGRLLALLCLSALLPVLFARFVPERLPALLARGGHAFPWPRLGWVCAFVVLTLYGWVLAERGGVPGPQVTFDDTHLAEVSGSQRFQREGGDLPLYLGWDADATDQAADTASLSSMTAAAQVRGYAGPLNLLVSVGRDGRLRGVDYLDSHETPSYIAAMDDWLAGLKGLDLGTSALDLGRVDALSGATVSSRAALESINRAARRAGREALGRELAPAGEVAVEGLGSPRFLATAALLVLCIPVYLWGHEGARLALLGVSLAVLGVWLNSLVTEVDLVNLSLGRIASPAENPQRWLLLGFVLVSSVLLGQVWCGYLCPFGALQEFISRLGRHLGLRGYPQRPLDTRVRFLKFALLALMLGAVWGTGESFWASFNPMQHAFAGRWEGWMGGLLVLVLAASLFYYRFWCRYLCPFGAFLALGNKLSLLHRFAPTRRFEHCDLGVREEFDTDCIHCNRCLTGRDTGIHPGHGGLGNPR
jgi:predicted membrane-bound spermidine synthase/uncharacterized protein with FMN-binding domain